MRWSCWWFAWSLAFGADGLVAPVAGYVRTGSGGVDRVLGLPGALVTEPVAGGDVEAVAFTGRLLFVKARDSIRVADESGAVLDVTSAPEGGAMFGLSGDLNAAVVYFPGANTLRVYSRGEWSEPVPCGDLLAVSLSSPSQVLAIAAGDPPSLIRIRVPDGAIETASDGSQCSADLGVRGNTNPLLALLPSGAILYVQDGIVRYRDTTCQEHQIDLPRDISNLLLMGPGWVHAETSSGRRFAVTLGTEVRVSEPPEAEP